MANAKGQEQLTLGNNSTAQSAGSQATVSAVPATVEENTAIQPSELVPGSLDWMKYQTARLQESGLVPADMHRSTILLLLTQGQAIGLTPMEAVKHGYVVNGVASFDTQTMAAQFRSAGGTFDFTEDTPEAATIVGIGPDGESHKLRITYQECEESGYTTSKVGGKWNWKGGANRRYMLKYRATAMFLKTYYPDVLFHPIGPKTTANIKEGPAELIRELLKQMGFPALVQMAAGLAAAAQDESLAPPEEVEGEFREQEEDPFDGHPGFSD